MLISSHQPHYLPWLRYFEKIARCDLFIILDDVLYDKNGFQKRSKIKTDQGWTYLTVPIRKHTQRPIYEIEIDNSINWRLKHRRLLELHYHRAAYFERYWPELAALYDREWTQLAELNRAVLELFLWQLEIRTPIAFSRDLPTRGRSTQRLAELCHAVGGDTYLSGAYAVQAYLDSEVLAAARVRLAVQEWRAPTYRQLYPSAGFIPDLSIADLLFNEGPRAREILLQAGGVTYPASQSAGSGAGSEARGNAVLIPAS
jgi:hypothetical protein